MRREGVGKMRYKTRGDNIGAAKAMANPVVNIHLGTLSYYGTA